jgi:hypothetical protein
LFYRLFQHTRVGNSTAGLLEEPSNINVFIKVSILLGQP